MEDEMFKAPAKLVMIDEDGNENEICGTINEVKVNPELIERDDMLFDDRMTNVKNYNFEYTISPKKLTKKRFIKQLMAMGMARNGAKDIAEYVHKKYGNYNSMFLMML